MIRKIQFALAGVVVASALVVHFFLPSIIRAYEMSSLESTLILGAVIVFFSIAGALFVDLFFSGSLNNVRDYVGTIFGRSVADIQHEQELSPEFRSLLLTFKNVIESERKQHDYLKQMSTNDSLRYQFITTLSHRLRTPITGMRWALTALSDELKKEGLGKETADILPLISDSAENIAELVEQVVAVATLEDSSLGLKKEDVNIEEIVAQVIKNDELAMRQKNISAKIERKGGSIPLLQGDRRQIGLAVDNLISNAIRYSSSGGSIFVTLMIDGSDVMVSVSDSGIGIPPDEMGALFSPFNRGKEAMRLHPDGSGLGLYLTKSIIDHHGGTISCTSVPRVGSTFIIRLPVAFKGQLEKFIQA